MKCGILFIPASALISALRTSSENRKAAWSILAKFTSLRLEQDSCMRDFASGSRERSLPTSSARFKT